MTAPHAYIPKMKINKFQQILDLPEIDKFRVECLNCFIDMTIHQNNKGEKFAIFHTAFMVYGWTNNINHAFAAKHNACIYDNGELYDLMRGRKI